MTDRRTIFLLLSQYVFNDIDSSSEEGDCELEELLTLIGLTEIERHPRQAGYINIIFLVLRCRLFLDIFESREQLLTI